MNSDSKFAAFYATFIAVALVGSLYAGRLKPSWNRVVFTFPPETQKVVENGTAIMEVKWRWLPDTLEMIVKVNDDEINYTRRWDRLGLLFDSDHSGNFADLVWYEVPQLDDHGVFINADNWCVVSGHCYMTTGEVFYPCSVSGYLKDRIAYLNDSYCVYREGEGYTFKLSIPIELIDVKSPTSIHASYWDEDYFLWTYHHHIEYEHKLAVLSAEFEG